MTPLNPTHDPALRSWVDSANADGTDFPIQNLPFGVFRRGSGGGAPAVGVAIGDQILDLARAIELGLLSGVSDAIRTAARAASLNLLAGCAAADVSGLRRQLSESLRAGNSRADERVLVPMNGAELLLPIVPSDYTDFYSSIFHATNVGRLFRPDNPLLPNYKYVPIGYGGRCSSIVISGTAVRRPCGQVSTAEGPIVKPSARLDYEIEIGFVAGTGTALGEPVSIDRAEDHVFGACLVNDWSARDIQAWEYQPLGPFLAKSFATSLSPWMVTLEALAPFRCEAFTRPAGDPAPLPHLFAEEDRRRGGFDLTVEVWLRSGEMRRSGQAPVRLSRGSFRDMYWTLAQLVAHQTSNGCNLRSGDLLASGTVSGPARGSEGCLLELTGQGSTPIELPTGEPRVFLEDDDEVIMRAVCERPGAARIGFGECRGVVLPARPG
jgi:fumarylacetoacetase